MIVQDLNEEKLTTRRVETSNWESVRLLLKIVTGEHGQELRQFVNATVSQGDD
ncbi:ectoine synthase (plasmid) [Mesorhizobium sp. AR07]|nr:ectoine synthase [Mesorhizobium sp. AR07]